MVAMTGTVAMIASSGDNQSQCCHGKVPLIDEFTAKLLGSCPGESSHLEWVDTR